VKSLSVNQLSVTIGTTLAVDDVSFDIAAGEVFGLIGESGSGKSTTALAIAGLLPPIAQATGRVLVDGDDLSALDAESRRRVRARRLGFVFQEPSSALNPLMTIGDQIAETLECLGTDRKSARLAALRTLEEVGLTARGVTADRYPHELSGGQRQRVVVGLAMIHRPRVLVADEPTTALDVTTQAQILDLLRTLVRDRGMSLLLISHDLAVVARYSDRVGVLKDGRLVETGPTHRILREPQHGYTASLLRAPSIERRSAPPSNGAPIIRARGVSRHRVRLAPRFFMPSDRHQILEDVSIDVWPGERLGLIGESGSGKSTLARILMGLEAFDAGDVTVEGTLLDKAAPRDPRRPPRVVQAVFQDPASSLNPRLRVGTIVGEPLRYARPRLDRLEQIRRVEEVLAQVGLDPDVVDRYPHEFSGGQRQRIALARALIARPRALILDEAVTALDTASRYQILSLLDDLQQEFGLAYLFITHDIELARTITDRLVVLQAGRIVETGLTDELLASPREPYTQALIRATPRWPPTSCSPAAERRDHEQGPIA
jgi:peptide/nickel transport system ATP-binding protein